MVTNEIRIFSRGGRSSVFRNMDSIEVVGSSLIFGAKGIKKEICKVTNNKFTISVQGSISSLSSPKTGRGALKVLPYTENRIYDMSINGVLPSLILSESTSYIGISFVGGDGNSCDYFVGGNSDDFVKYILEIDRIFDCVLNNKSSRVVDVIDDLNKISVLLNKSSTLFASSKYVKYLDSLKVSLNSILSSYSNNSNVKLSSLWVAVSRFRFTLSKLVNSKEFNDCRGKVVRG